MIIGVMTYLWIYFYVLIWTRDSLPSFYTYQFPFSSFYNDFLTYTILISEKYHLSIYIYVFTDFLDPIN